MTAVAVRHREAILERVKGGEILAEIAPDYKVSKQALHQVLRDDPEYQVAKRIQAASMIDEAKIETWKAREPLDIARAREMTRFAFRYAESVDSANWGQKIQSLNINVQVSADELVGSAEDLLKSVAGRVQTQRTIESHATVCNDEDASP